MTRNTLENNDIFNPIIRTGLKLGITAMPDAAGPIDADMGPVIYMKGTASRTLTLPAVTADMKGLTLYFLNGAAFTVVVNNASAGAVATVPATIGATGMIVCLGDPTLGIGGWTGGL